MKLRSNTILITGGGSGIGYELTKQLTALGNTILITGRDHERFLGIGICPIAHFTGLLRHQGRSAFVHRVSSCATEKHQSEGI